MSNERDHSNPTKQSAPLTVTRPELLENGTDDAFRSMVHAALAFAARLQMVREGYAEIVDLTGPQYTILISLAHLKSDRPIGVKELADHLCLSGTFVTTEVNKLVKRGLMLKEKDASDGRRVSLSVTSKASALLSELSSIQTQVNDAHFGSLSAEEFKVLCKVMPELVQTTDGALSLLKHLGDMRKISA